MPVAPSRPLNVLLPTIGSAGDVHPVIATAITLRRRGHRATIITNPHFEERVRDHGIDFAPLGARDDYARLVANPDLWHPTRGFGVIAREAMLPAMPAVYDTIARLADERTVVATSCIALGARIAHEKLHVPLATLNLQPAVLRSLHDYGMAGFIRLSARQPRWFKKLFFALADRLLVDRILAGPVNRFRASLGLAPVRNLFAGWIHSPQLVVGFFPDWFAPPQPDWPAHTHLVGFPLWDAGAARPLSPEAETFLSEGPPPVVFTPGSAGATMHAFFRESVAAVRALGVRAMLVTNHPEQLPRELPPGVRAFGYLPFGAVLPRAAALVYHGGVGTLAQTVKAGIPHLVVPHSHDQFDNADRITRLGIGHSLRESRYRADRAAALLRTLLGDEPLRARCRAFSPRIDSDAALERACELIEQLPPARGSR